MLVERFVLVSSAIGLVVFWIGCKGNQTSTNLATYVPEQEFPQPAQACIHDADCRSGFCDRAFCAPRVPAHGSVRTGEACARNADCRSGLCARGECFDMQASYGDRCDLPGPDAGPVDKLPERICGGFLCLDGRCRSCTSDEECQSYFGMGKCTALVQGSGWPEVATCHPATARRTELALCTEDAQCQSLLCDHGRCAAIRPLGFKNYGKACEPGPPKAPLEDFHATPPEGTCEGYVCVDRKCRSCVSDAECQGGPGGLKCLHFDDWPGTVCVTPAEAERHPSSRVPSKPPTVDVDARPPRPAPRVPPAPRSPSRRP